MRDQAALALFANTLAIVGAFAIIAHNALKIKESNTSFLDIIF